MPAPISRSDLVDWLDEELDNVSFNDASLNGLQVEGRESVHRIGVAVDACQATIDAAVTEKVDMLLVHHGLFWGHCERVVGRMARRLKALLGAGINLYASHLPLDSHPQWGNNAQLARLLDLQDLEPFGRYKGREIGFVGNIAPMDAARVGAKLQAALDSPVRLWAFGPPLPHRIAVVSGGGASLLSEAVEKGLCGMVTGEAPHEAYSVAEEGALNTWLAGHYATETLGVKALAGAIRERWGIPWVFLDHPTGL